MNIITLVGRLTRDPETVDTPTGKTKVQFALAVPRRFKRDETMFFNVAAWGKVGDVIAMHARKGDRIVVSGELTMRDYDGRDGQKRTWVEVDLDQFTFCGGKEDVAPPQPGQAASEPPPPPRIYSDQPAQRSGILHGTPPPPDTAYVQYNPNEFEAPPFPGDEDVPF